MFHVFAKQKIHIFQKRKYQVNCRLIKEILWRNIEKYICIVPITQ